MDTTERTVLIGSNSVIAKNLLELNCFDKVTTVSRESRVNLPITYSQIHHYSMNFFEDQSEGNTLFDCENPNLIIFSWPRKIGNIEEKFDALIRNLNRFKFRIRTIVFISSVQVYGKRIQVAGNFSANPDTEYGRNKLLLETKLALNVDGRIPLILLRLGHVVCQDSWLDQCIKDKKTILPLFYNGKFNANIIDIKNLSSLIKSIIASPYSGTINAVDKLTWFEFCRKYNVRYLSIDEDKSESVVTLLKIIDNRKTPIRNVYYKILNKIKRIDLDKLLNKMLLENPEKLLSKKEQYVLAKNFSYWVLSN